MGFEDVLVKIHRETARPGRWIAHPLARFWIEHFHHHTNDMTRGAELSARASGVKSAKQILIEIALNILILLRDVHRIDRFAGFDE